MSLTASVTATFSATMNASTITGTTFLLTDSSNNAVAGTVTYNNLVATFTPTAALKTATVYTATVKSGASGVKDSNGNALAADFSWSFTTLTDTTPPTVTSVSPTAGSTGIATTTSVSAVFSEALNAATVTGSTFQLFGPSNSLVAATVTYNSGSQTATLQPNASLAVSTTYTVVLTGGTSGIKDVAGNALASNFTWSFTTAGVVSATCPCSVWSSVDSSGCDRRRRRHLVRIGRPLPLRPGRCRLSVCGSTRAPPTLELTSVICGPTQGLSWPPLPLPRNRAQGGSRSISVIRFQLRRTPLTWLRTLRRRATTPPTPVISWPTLITRHCTPYRMVWTEPTESTTTDPPALSRLLHSGPPTTGWMWCLYRPAARQRRRSHR